MAKAPPTAITLRVVMTKQQGVNRANLSWTGAVATVNILRNNVFLRSVTGETYADNLGKGGGTRTYQVCNTVNLTCSKSVTVTY